MVLSKISNHTSPNHLILYTNFDSKLTFNILWQVLCLISLREFKFLGSPNPWVLFSSVRVSCWKSPLAFYISTRPPVYLVARLSCRDAINIMLLGSVCFTMPIWTQITCSAHFLLVLSEFDIQSSSIGVLKYQDVERPNLQGVSYWPMLECGMTWPTKCLKL